MPPIVLVAVQVLFLILLYLFLARAVRAVLRDVAVSSASGSRHDGAQPQPRPGDGAWRSDPRTQPRELVVHSPDQRPRVVPLDSHDITFGRADTSTIVLDDAYASDHHAKVFLDEGQWCVSDLGSTNGTYRNQVKVTGRTPVAAGDQLGIGKTVVEVRR